MLYNKTKQNSMCSFCADVYVSPETLKLDGFNSGIVKKDGNYSVVRIQRVGNNLYETKLVLTNIKYCPYCGRNVEDVT